MAEINTKLISIERLATYKTLTDSQLNSLRTEIDTEIANLKLPYELIDSLPTPAIADYCNRLYLVPSSNTDTNDIYEEYLCVEKDNTYSWERFGTVSVTEILKGTSSGSGNAVTDIRIDGNTITLIFDKTFTTVSDVTNVISDAIGTTITAAALGALTAITSTDGDSSGSVVTNVSASANTVTVTKGDLSLEDLSDAEFATDNEITALFT